VPISLRLLTPICFLILSSATFAQPADQHRDYKIEDLTLGAQIQSLGSAYQQYRCGPSGQSKGFTFCQKIRFERDSRGSFNVMISFLHSRDGKVVYIDRYQHPAFLDADDSERTIKEFSSRFGEPSWTTRMPERQARPNGVIAAWGNAILEPIDEAHRQALVDGRGAGGYLVDFLGDLTRSAKERLPIYRFRGLAGFVWVANFDHEGHGIARSTALDASAFNSDLSPNKQ
jgi:hypothetical protein